MVNPYNVLFYGTCLILFTVHCLWENGGRELKSRILEDHEMTEHRIHFDISESRQRIVKQITLCESAAVTASIGKYLINVKLILASIPACRA